MSSRRWARHLGVALGIGAALLGIGRFGARWLVREDPLQPAQVVLLSIGGGYTGAVEAARLQVAGTAPRVVLTRWASGPDSAADDLRRLGVWVPTPSAVVQSILERSGVPATAIERVDREVDGTGPDIATLAAYVRARGWQRVAIVTARSHTRRAGWLLRRALPAGVAVQVHSAPADPFTPEGWWRSRAMTREVLMESLRWVNAGVLGDPWRD
jgi:uncharacterized SAM-binding protein YcdF (DUF218 family)